MTMILEIDAGNTCIKWRLRESAGGLSSAMVTRGRVFAPQQAVAAFDGLAGQLGSLPLAKISRILVASVRGENFNKGLSALMVDSWNLRPEYAAATAESCGVINGYTEPARLGVDRWLAVVAAYRRTRDACCVVDCGTTITIDLVGTDGRHLGGYIVPGLQLLRETLAGRSQALAVAWSGQDSVAPGTSTGAAIQNGIFTMALGLLQQVHRQSGSCHWLLTGGDAQVLSPLLDWEHELVHDLVLDGLALTMAPPDGHGGSALELP